MEDQVFEFSNRIKLFAAAFLIGPVILLFATGSDALDHYNGVYREDISKSMNLDDMSYSQERRSQLREMVYGGNPRLIYVTFFFSLAFFIFCFAGLLFYLLTKRPLVIDDFRLVRKRLLRSPQVIYFSDIEGYREVPGMLKSPLGKPLWSEILLELRERKGKPKIESIPLDFYSGFSISKFSSVVGQSNRDASG